MPEIVTRTLACGLPLLVEPSTAVRSAAVSWLLPAGTAMDPADQLGRSAMFAELLFRGAGSLDSKAQADALDRLGLGRGCEVGGVFLRLAATMIADRVHEALHLLADMALRPRFDDAAIEPTRQLCMQAVAGLNDEPAERAANILLQRHNPAPLNRAGVGTEEGLANVTADSLRAGWAQCVRPGGSILAVAGNVDPDAVAATLDAALAGWSGAAAIPPVTPSPTAGTLHHQHDLSNQVHIYLAHHAPAEPHPDSLLEKLVTGVLSAGSSSRLFTEVREKRGLCYSVSAGYGGDKSFGKVTAYVGTTPEKAQQSLDVLLAELRKLEQGRGIIAPDEFDRTMTGVRTRLVFAGESTSARAAALTADYHRLGRGRTLADIAREYAAVSLADLNAYVQRRRIGAPTVVTLGPSPLTLPA
ncbi:MAG: M16 family metallopeptidase [bacterium]